MFELRPGDADYQMEFGAPTARWARIAGAPQLPLTNMWMKIEGGDESELDEHEDHEVIQVINGVARVVLDSTSVTLHPGDAVYMAPFERHRVINPSESQLLILSTSWVS